jgi:hypothetical protein
MEPPGGEAGKGRPAARARGWLSRPSACGALRLGLRLVPLSASARPVQVPHVHLGGVWLELGGMEYSVLFMLVFSCKRWEWSGSEKQKIL